MDLTFSANTHDYQTPLNDMIETAFRNAMHIRNTFALVGMDVGIAASNETIGFIVDELRRLGECATDWSVCQPYAIDGGILPPFYRIGGFEIYAVRERTGHYIAPVVLCGEPTQSALTSGTYPVGSIVVYRDEVYESVANGDLMPSLIQRPYVVSTENHTVYMTQDAVERQIRTTRRRDADTIRVQWDRYDPVWRDYDTVRVAEDAAQTWTFTHSIDIGSVVFQNGNPFLADIVDHCPQGTSPEDGAEEEQDFELSPELDELLTSMLRKPTQNQGGGR